MVMTPSQQQAEERRAALRAVAYSLTSEELVLFLRNARRRLPHLDGVAASGVLDYTTAYGEFQGWTGPFFEVCQSSLPASLDPARLIAVHALVILGRELTVPAVLDLLRRAGSVDPEPEESPGGFQHGRQLTPGERDELRHLLQVHMENVRRVRNAVEPATGAFGFSVGQWTAQWRDLKKVLDFWTEHLQNGA